MTNRERFIRTLRCEKIGGQVPTFELGQHRTIHKRHFSEQQQPRKARITLLIDSREHTASSRQAGPVSQKQIC